MNIILYERRPGFICDGSDCESICDFCQQVDRDRVFGCLTFENALAAIGRGAEYSLSGRTLFVNGLAMAITGAEFDQLWDFLDELEGDDFDVRLPT